MRFFVLVIVLAHFAFASPLHAFTSPWREKIRLKALTRKFNALPFEIRAEIRTECVPRNECLYVLVHAGADECRKFVLECGEKRIIEEYKRLPLSEKVKGWVLKSR